MKILDIQWSPYRLPLRSSFTTAHGTLRYREGAIVEITTTEGISGTGEIAPFPEFGGGNLRDALAPLPAVRTLLQGKSLSEALALLYEDSVRALPASTACGLEIALLDARGQAERRPLASLLAVSDALRSRVPVNAVIGAQTTDAAVARAQEAVAAGFGCVKLKVGNDLATDLERIAAVRGMLGYTTHLRLDANAGWTFEQARTLLHACEILDIQYVEQPLDAGNLAGMRELRRTTGIAIAADEAVSDLASVRRVLAEEAADMLIIKPQLVGGLRASQHIMREAAEQGARCVITSAIESGIGIAALLHLVAASPEITLECGLATLHLLADDFLRDSLTIQRGSLTVPGSPGLGVRLDREALARYKTC